MKANHRFPYFDALSLAYTQTCPTNTHTHTVGKKGVECRKTIFDRPLAFFKHQSEWRVHSKRTLLYQSMMKVANGLRVLNCDWLQVWKE